MKKVLLIITIFHLVVACGQRQKVVAERQELDTAIQDTVSGEEVDSKSPSV